MRLSAIENIQSRFRNWVAETCDQTPLIYFTRVFAAIWLVYDAIDLSQSQILTNFWFMGAPIQPQLVIASQIGVIVCEVGMLIGFYPRLFALGAVIARAALAVKFPLNDYSYFCVTALILSQCKFAERKAWPRDILVLQTAWIYFTSAILKMNPSFFRGGDLYVRQNYVAAVLPFPYPSFYRNWIADIHNDALMAGLGIAIELLLAGTLFFWWRLTWRRGVFRGLSILLAASVHLYAAYALNVFFFGASILAQVIFMTQES